MIERKLYHIDLFMPDRFISYAKEHQSHMTKVKFSQHLLDYFENGDDKHDLTRKELLESLKRCVINPVVPFEVEAADIWVKKYVIRTSYNEEKDISIAIVCKDYKSWLPFIKTAWLNNKDDIHNTLDVFKYSWSL